MNTKFLQFIFAVLVAGLLADCAVTQPPPLPQNNPADPQARGSSAGPRNLLVRDETTLAIEKELQATETDAKSAESMHHDMNNMPGMQQGDMPGMQHTAAEPEKKVVADEMKKTSEAMKQKSDQINQHTFYYTCMMHPQVHQDKPGKCPICGMTLIKKEAGQ
jgi:rubrerythrin